MAVPASVPSTVFDDAINEALKNIPVQVVSINDSSQYEVEVFLQVKVTFEGEASQAALDEVKMKGEFVSEAMGAICCKCVRWENGSWLCHGTCC